MLVAFVERDGAARLILILLTLTTLGCFSYSWGYYEGFHNAKVLAQLESPPAASSAATNVPDVHNHDPTQRKVQHSSTGKSAEGEHNADAPDAGKIDSAGKAKHAGSTATDGLIRGSHDGSSGQTHGMHKEHTRSLREALLNTQFHILSRQGASLASRSLLSHRQQQPLLAEG